MSKFTWSDIVTAKPDAPKELRPGSRAWIVGLSAQHERSGTFLETFPQGIVYTIEFEDGSSTSAAEADLTLLWRKDQPEPDKKPE
jgi:hypothetical protein